MAFDLQDSVGESVVLVPLEAALERNYAGWPVRAIEVWTSAGLHNEPDE